MEKHKLQLYETQLVTLRQHLIRRVKSAEESLREDISPPGTVSKIPTHPADDTAEGLDEQIAIAQNEEQLLEEVDRALERISSGTFGVCSDCGQAIMLERLDAIPYTAWCIKCAHKHDRPGKSSPE